MTAIKLQKMSICPSKRPFRSCWPMTDPAGQPSTTSDIVPHEVGKGEGGEGENLEWPVVCPRFAPGGGTWASRYTR